VRTLQKRIMKRRSYVRKTKHVVFVAGSPTIVAYRKGEGPILDPQENPIGRHWPRFIPKQAEAA
jgi:hypothetical protein